MSRPFNCFNARANNNLSAQDYIQILNKRNCCLPLCDLYTENRDAQGRPIRCICPEIVETEDDHAADIITKIDYVPPATCSVPFNNNKQATFKTDLISPDNCVQCCSGGGGGGGGGGGTVPVFHSLITTNATPTVFFSNVIEVDKLLTVHGVIQARGDTHAISAQFSGTAINEGGGSCSMVGAPVIIYNTTTEGTDIDMQVIACSLTVIVTGLATEHMKWVSISYVVSTDKP